MIVKNESHIIEETLAHLCDYFKFSYWVISDTGSTDGTQDLIRNFFAKRGIPGELKEDAWRDFGYNRTKAFEHAYKKSDWVLVWDADDSIVGKMALPAKLEGDAYQFIFGDETGFRYTRLQMFNNHKRWKYVGVLHEYPACIDKMEKVTHVQGEYYFVSGRKGSRNNDPLKYQKDAEVLERALLEEPNNDRYAYYCGNSYMNANIHDKAIEWYKKTLKMNGWVEEKYNCCLNINEMLEGMGRAEEGIPYLIESYKHVPNRVEGIYRLVKYYAGKEMYQVAFAFYTLIQDYYENKFLKDDVSTHLFTKKYEYDFYLPYFMVIVATKVGRHDVAAKMYEIICSIKYKHVPDWWLRNLFHNLQFVEKFPTSLEFLQNLVEYREMFGSRQFEVSHDKNIGDIIDRHRPLLTAAPSRRPHKKSGAPRIVMTFTTCKRLDLFEKTMNSILNTWKDINAVDYFFCVDDNSDKKDRKKMRTLYPFIDYHMKTPEERGHRTSMNIIWNKLAELKPKYWIHMEDDWLFFKSDNYVSKSIQFLDKYESRGIHQILYNRNYTETYNDWGVNGGEQLEPGFTVHVKSDRIPGRNSAYWPHYSFRPSMVRADKILELGNYDSPNTFFERDYAERWFAKGYRSGFFDSIVSLHIGKLTSDRTGTNAYTLNNMSQFGGSGKQPNIHIINLARRPDRRTGMRGELSKQAIPESEYQFTEAVDGTTLLPNESIINMFKGNDFGDRRAFIGCALSHYNLWTKLLADKSNDYYVIFEDDVKLTDAFKDTFKKLKVEKTWDFLYLGYSCRNDEYRDAKLDAQIVPVNMEQYVGGFFGYIITKQGAQKMVDYIKANGIKHGIDYLPKKEADTFTCMSLQPHIVRTEWVRSADSTVDSDIQKDYARLSMALPSIDDWDFYLGFDSLGGDVGYVGKKTPQEFITIAAANSGCVAFNTLGFMKESIKLPLVESRYFGPTDGIYIKKGTQPRKIRVKLLCNWAPSHVVCQEWKHMMKGATGWDTVEIVANDKDIDYYLIINYPIPGEKYEPEKTIVYQLEPWCGESYQTNGVKTWGPWAKPAHVRKAITADTTPTPAFWQTSWSYTDYMTKEITTVKADTIAHIASAKYVDPGHKQRVDFLRFLEEKGDVSLKMFGRENFHSFKNYAGKVPEGKKEDCIEPYKYYFMVENNSEKNYVTEKLWESILHDTLCFYSGPPNITEILDPEAYVLLDMSDFEKAYETVKQAIAENWWEKRLPAIRAAKKKILNEYSVFARLEQIVATL